MLSHVWILAAASYDERCAFGAKHKSRRAPSAPGSPAAAAGSKDQAYGTIITRKNSGGVTLIDSEKLLLLAVTSGPIDVKEFPVGTFEC